MGRQINEKLYERKLIKLGESLAIIIPIKICYKYDLKAGDKLLVKDEDGSILLIIPKFSKEFSLSPSKSPYQPSSVSKQQEMH